MQLSQQLAQRPLASARRCSRSRAQQSALRAQQVSTIEAPAKQVDAAPVPQDGTEDIYLGFAKGDVREGKGRVIRDDPSKYPGKEDVAGLPGAVGGWAGGEAGLWQLREQVMREKAAKRAAEAAVASSSSAQAQATARPPSPKGELKPIYVGYSKDELEVRKSGAPGRFVLDDPKKYPGKEDIGFLPGATGGFAGGEAGLRQFVETGELKLRQPGAPGGKQTSPVAIAGLLVAAGAGGGLLLNEVTDLGEGAVKAEILNAPIDEKTKALLLAAIALLGGVGVLATGKAVVSSLESKISSAGDQAKKLVIGGAFWLGVFFAARAVLEL